MKEDIRDRTNQNALEIVIIVTIYPGLYSGIM